MPQVIRVAPLASQLTTVQQMSMDNPQIGWFTQVDEQVGKLLGVFPSLAIAHHCFKRARREIRANVINSTSWEQMQRAADGLASELQKLGDVSVELCERQTQHGICGYALMSDGTCTTRLQHSES